MIAPSTNRRRVSGQGILDNSELLLAPMYSAEAEKAVLGSFLANPQAVADDVTSELRSEDFFVPAHQILIEVMSDMWRRLQPIDITTVHQSLVDRRKAEVCGSPGILAELAAGLATYYNVGAYIGIVKQKAALRALQAACAKIQERVIQGGESVDDVLNFAEREIMAVGNCAINPGSVSTMAERVNEALARYDAIAGSGRATVGIPSGLAKLDLMTHGWVGGQMIVLAARPGVGKSALAFQFARFAAEERWQEEAQRFVKPGYCVGVLELEMTGIEVADRDLAAFASVEMGKIKTGTMTPEERAKVGMMAQDLASLPIYLDDEGGLKLAQLRAKARRMVQKYGAELLIIDYLQLMSGDDESDSYNRQNEVATISRSIKALAKELNIPIIVLAQLNRKAAEKNEAPGLHNLRESGAIEQDADIVMFIHNDNGYYSLIIAKGRNIQTGTIPISFNGACQKFSEVV